MGDRPAKKKSGRKLEKAGSNPPSRHHSPRRTGPPRRSRSKKRTGTK